MTNQRIDTAIKMSERAMYLALDLAPDLPAEAAAEILFDAASGAVKLLREFVEVVVDDDQ
jgi:hypothetical protein